ncbi:MAG: hypothetical protein KBB37_04770 [Bacteroidia bacterium]|nr:hypothetical protein [Bacteroidia bacterium]MBP7260580.1 hypothetical protein [Bacteroidia bacterium]MBP9179840.1 hypothetical protein [Bacteroidia bacterium]MBP9724202.1 hypothetical protein [Bacteroidia bacterium]
MNQLIDEIEERKKKEQPEVKKSTTGKQMAQVADFDFFITRENMQKAFPFFMFLAGIAIFYIANTHYAEKTIRQSDKLTKEIKELRSEYITIKSDLMFRSKQSEVAQRLLQKEIKPLTTPPKKIVVQAE